MGEPDLSKSTVEAKIFLLSEMDSNVVKAIKEAERLSAKEGVGKDEMGDRLTDLFYRSMKGVRTQEAPLKGRIRWKIMELDQSRKK